HLRRVQVPEHVGEDDPEDEPEEDRVLGLDELAAHERNTTDQDTDTVEHVVEPAAEHGPVALQAGDLAVHAVEHETQMEEHGAGQQPVPVREEERSEEHTSELK